MQCNLFSRKTSRTAYEENKMHKKIRKDITRQEVELKSIDTEGVKHQKLDQKEWSGLRKRKEKQTNMISAKQNSGCQVNRSFTVP